MSIYIITVFMYLVLMIGVSLYRAFRVKGQDDFMVGGRNVSTLLMITTLVATWTGAGSLTGGAGLAYRQGFSQLWMSVGAWIAILIVYKLAGRVRTISQYTLPDILEKRYNGLARILGCITLVIGCTTIVGYQLRSGAMILQVLAGIANENGVVLIGIAVIILTLLGGMKSVVSLDLLNGILMFISLLVSLPLLFFATGGVEAVKEALPETHFTLCGGKNLIWAISVFLPPFFLLLGEPSMYQKFFSCKDESSAKKAVIGWVIGVIIIDVSICTLGVLGRIKFPELAASGKSEEVIFNIAKYGLPAWTGCLLLAGSMAIVFSTANSFLLTPATNITHDIIQRFIFKNADQKIIVNLNRAIIVILGVAASLVLMYFKNVLSMALTAYTMIGSGLTPAILAAFFWRRVTIAGGIASIIGGMVSTIITKIIFDMKIVQQFFTSNYSIPGDQLGEYIIIPAFIVATLLLIVVSLCGKKPDPSKSEAFFK